MAYSNYPTYTGTADWSRHEYDNLVPKLLAAASLPVLEEEQSFVRDVGLAHRDHQSQLRANKGQAIVIPVPVPTTTRKIQASPLEGDFEGLSMDDVTLTLTEWEESIPIFMADAEHADFNSQMHFLVPQLSEAMRALINKQNAFIASKTAKISQYTGDPAQFLFTYNTGGGSNVAPVIAAAYQLDEFGLAPQANRRLVIGNFEMMYALNQQIFQFAEHAGSNQALVENQIRRAMGMNWGTDHDLFKQTTVCAGATIDADTLAGATSALIDFTGINTPTPAPAADPRVGDIFTVAGDTRSDGTLRPYAVTDYSAATGVVSFLPKSVVAWANTTTVTFVGQGAGQYRNNVALHPSCIAFASRLPPLTNNANKANIGELVHNRSGTAFRLERVRGNHGDTWKLSTLFGAECIRPQLGVRILSKAS